MTDDRQVVILERDERVAIARINRPDARNALSDHVRAVLTAALNEWEDDPGVGCVVIAGSDDFFASGADIKALRDRSFTEAMTMPGGRFWSDLAACKAPIVAAVSGFALGGGCELALACDMIVASETAEFGQPEITLGIIPGGGGSQRLTRLVGKQRAMDLVLTGRRIDAREAHELGIVNKIAPRGKWLEEAVELAHVVARRPWIAARLAKQAILAADEMPLTAGMVHERRLFELAMATDDRVEGMSAFIEKRPPRFTGK